MTHMLMKWGLNKTLQLEVGYCEDPGLVLNGFLLNWGGRVPFGASITYHCNEGFDVVGSNILTCQSDGTWDTPPPRCGRSYLF